MNLKYNLSLAHEDILNIIDETLKKHNIISGYSVNDSTSFFDGIDVGV